MTATKSTKSMKRIVVTVLWLFAFASASFAATPKLEAPRGLAVDYKGNLYVANSAGNNILVYSPGYALQNSRTITQDISQPMGVAFDQMGDLWVANFTSNTVTVYSLSLGQQLTKLAITAAQGINNPFAIAVDGAGNVYVQNNWNTVSMYYPMGCCSVPVATFGAPLQPWQPNSLRGIAAGAGVVVVGSTSGYYQNQVDYIFQFPNSSFGGGPISNPFSLAADNHGGFYLANDTGAVTYQTTFPGDGLLGDPFTVVTLSYVPTGVAVDNARGRLYFSNYNASTIDVYTTWGKYLHTIQ